MTECAIFFALLTFLVAHDIWVIRRYSAELERINSKLLRLLRQEEEEL